MKFRKIKLAWSIIFSAILLTVTACAEFNNVSPPMSLKATDSTEYNDRVIVTWDKVDGVDYYQLWRSENPESTKSQFNNSFGSVSSVNPSSSYMKPEKTKDDSEDGYEIIAKRNLIKNTFTDNSIEPGKTYYYKVRAVSKQFVYSEFSNYDTGGAGTFPDSPKNIIATDGKYSDQILVTWDSVSDAVTYRVYRSKYIDSGYECISGDIPAKREPGQPSEPPVNNHCEFISDVDLSGGVSITASGEASVRLKIGDTVNTVISFPGAAWTGTKYSQADIVSKVNEAVRTNLNDDTITVCTASGNQYVKIESDIGSIILESESDYWFKNSLSYFFKEGISGSEIIQVDPTPVTEEGETWTAENYFVDTEAVVATMYYYKVITIDEDGEESVCPEPNNGFTVSPIAPKAPPSITSSSGTVGEVDVTWMPVGGVEYYRLYRSNSPHGLYTQVGSDIKHPGSQFKDTTIFMDSIYFYRVVSIDSNGLMSAFSDYSQAQAEITPLDFTTRVYRDYSSAKAKLDYIEPNPLGSLDITVNGDIGGTCRWVIKVSGTTGNSTHSFQGYQDTCIALTGELKSKSGMSGDGTVNGTIDITGQNTGYVKYFVEYRNREDSSGYFMTSYPEGTEEQKIMFTDVKANLNSID